MLRGLEERERGKERLSPSTAAIPNSPVRVSIGTLTGNLSFSSPGPGNATTVQLLRPKDREMGDSEPVNCAVWLLVTVCPEGTVF